MLPSESVSQIELLQNVIALAKHIDCLSRAEYVLKANKIDINNLDDSLKSLSDNDINKVINMIVTNCIGYFC